MKPASVLVLYNHPLLPLTHPDADSENSVVEIAEAMAKVLVDAGYHVSLLGLKQDPTELWRELEARQPSAVLNLFEGNLDDPETESYVAGLLQWKGIPFTGSPMETLALARAKHTTKCLLRGAGLPTSDFYVVNELPLPPSPISFPVIVKPARQDASVGVNQSSVCTDALQVEQRVKVLLETYGAPVIVEEFVRGRELNVALLELPTLEFLPPAEIIFPEERPGYWPILTYDGKWKPGTPDYETQPPEYPADLSPEIIAMLGKYAMDAYRLLGCRDYARVDFRMGSDFKPYILEVNPNPEISDAAGFAGCLGSADLKYKEFLVRLIQQTIGRTERPRPTFAMDQVVPPTPPA